MDLINKFQALTPGMKLTIVLVSVFSLILVYCMFNRNNLLNTQEEKEVNVFSENFNSNTSNAVFTMYYADWCPHCQAAKPEFKKMMKYNNKKFGNKTLELVMVDCEKNPELAEKEGVEGYPTFSVHNQSVITVSTAGVVLIALGLAQFGKVVNEPVDPKL